VSNAGESLSKEPFPFFSSHRGNRVGKKDRLHGADSLNSPTGAESSTARPKKDEIHPWLFGLIERAFLTTAIAFNVSGVAFPMIARLAAKLGGNWGSPQARDRRQVVPRPLWAPLAGLASMLFALIGGVIIAEGSGE